MRGAMGNGGMGQWDDEEREANLELEEEEMEQKVEEFWGPGEGVMDTKVRISEITGLL